jgi:hypothetical protein
MIETLRFNFIEDVLDGGIGELPSPSYPKSLAVHDLNPLARLQKSLQSFRDFHLQTVTVL